MQCRRCGYHLSDQPPEEPRSHSSQLRDVQPGSRRKRGMFDKFIARDIDGDGDIDLLGTRGNSAPFDGVFWLEQQRTEEPSARFTPARQNESPEMPLP